MCDPVTRKRKPWPTATVEPRKEEEGRKTHMQ